QGALRVWIPGANKVELIIGKEPRVELVREGESGFILKQERDLRYTHYKLAVDWSGVEQIIDDPYQYHDLYMSYEDLHTPK
ncbi:1,4-alpha-glucan branching enzyme, partial [Vibrio sp. 10N.222.55.E8]